MKNYLLKKIISISVYPMIFIGAMWLVHFTAELLNTGFSRYGILPRDLKGLRGVVLSVFIHGDRDHLFSNTLPILVLGMMLFFFYKRIAKQVFLWIWLISGIWLWIGGRNNEHYPVYHIGASTLIYGLATFLFFSGVFRKHLRLMVVSALVVFLYGSIMWGIFPFKQEISWEGHLFGALAGLLVAFNYRKDGPQRRVYEWENENDDDQQEESQDNSTLSDTMNENAPPTKENEIPVNYIYKEDPFKKPGRKK